MLSEPQTSGKSMMKTANRKRCVTFHFSVEGETEAIYLEWLQGIINTANETSFSVRFDVKVCPPISYVKSTTISQPTTICHLCDYESSGEEHRKRFMRLLDQMREAEKLGKQVRYILGYCNFSFELWILMHVTNAQKSLSDRSCYLKELNKAFHVNFSSMKEFKKKRNLKNIFSKLSLENVRLAIERSQVLMKQKNEDLAKPEIYKKFDFYKENPSLSVGKIFADIFNKLKLKL